MAEDTTANADPSMEEILASIRKIISDDAPPAAAPAEPVPAQEEEVLELTQMVEEDGSVTDLAAAPEPEIVVASPLPPPAATLPPVLPSEPLVSAPAASSAASALSSLASTVEIERLSATPLSATYIGNGARTLEDMAIELMRPLLKDWLDKNLPAVVDRLVQKEIERIARRS